MSSALPAIEVKEISKIYRLGVKASQEENFVSTVVNTIKSPIANYKKYRSLYKFDDVDQSQREDSESILWALKDISFSLDHGEVVGLIGHNGAGKSTLLKVISRITPPSHGRIEMRGRVASLLEVGTGFHPELTGRENIFLNGTVLGMTRREVTAKFDEIVAFSEVEDFLDTPVKRYSSGMRVRLAFSVAAHLEPEILIVDEVLAVGDASFQKKCLSKMEDVGEQGRTVIFVSHNMAAITRLCKRGLLVGHGRLLMDGPMYKVVDAYLNNGMGTAAQKSWDEDSAPGRDIARLRQVQVVDEDKKVCEAFDIRNPVGLQMTYDVLKSDYVLLPNFRVFNQEGVPLFTTVDQDVNWKGKPRPSGTYTSTVWFPGNFFAEGMHYVKCALMTISPNMRQFGVSQMVGFQVLDSTEVDTARTGWGGNMLGVVRPVFDWETQTQK